MGLTTYYTDRAGSASLQATLPRKVAKSNVRNSLLADVPEHRSASWQPGHRKYNLLQYHHEAIFFCCLHGFGKTPILPNRATMYAAV
jgi:hypothetical protein